MEVVVGSVVEVVVGSVVEVVEGVGGLCVFRKIRQCGVLHAVSARTVQCSERDGVYAVSSWVVRVNAGSDECIV